MGYSMKWGVVMSQQVRDELPSPLVEYDCSH
jgi:hypothetical protein